jgi:hypothetical protein
MSGNTAGVGGGGILAFGTVTLTNSTVSGNTAQFDGGGIFAGNGGTIRNSTIAFNTAAGDGGGIFVFNGTIDIGNSIVAKNTAGTSPDIGSSTVGTGYINAGNNLIGINTGFEATFPTGALIGTASTPVDPLLAPLANNGGATLTHALLTGSPAINAGNNALIPSGVTEDQRGTGFPRIVFTTVDIGAFEVQSTPTPTPTPTPAPVSAVPNIQPEIVIRTTETSLFCGESDEFVPVNFQGTVILVPIQKCNPVL